MSHGDKQGILEKRKWDSMKHTSNKKGEYERVKEVMGKMREATYNQGCDA